MFRFFCIIAVTLATSFYTGQTGHSHADLFLSLQTLPSHTNNIQFVDELISRLLKEYRKEAVIHRPVVVHMDILLLQVKNTIEKEGILESVIALMMDWKDIRMQWNPTEYGNLTFLSLSPEQVWLPDIAMTNSADHLYSISRDSRFTVRVSYEGMFRFAPTGTSKSWCDLKLITFPFDIQQCWLEFESWSLDSTVMTFDGNSDILVDDSFASMQFQLCEHHSITYHHTYKFTGETFTRVRFYFTVKRKSTFYVMNLILPIMILSFIQIFLFLIPCIDTNADRIAFGTTNLLTLVVYQTIITEQLPKSSDAVTALSKYVIILIITAAVGIGESVIVERLQSRTLLPPPQFIMKILKPIPVLLRETPAQLNRRLAFSEKSASFAGFENQISYSERETPHSEESGSLSKIARRESYRKALFHEQGSKRQIKQAINHQKICNQKQRNTLSKTNSFFQDRTIRNRGRKVHCFSLCKRANKTMACKLLNMTNGNQPRPSPSSLWTELAFKVDFITFVICILSASVSPLILFFPLVFFDGNPTCTPK